MSALQKPSTVGMQKGLDAAQAEPAAPPTPNPYLEADRRNARPPKPIRVTLDLDETRHAFLKEFSGAGISSAQVLRALLDELQANSDLQANIRARIWAAKR